VVGTAGLVPRPKNLTIGEYNAKLPPTTVLCLGAVERQGSDPQGAVSGLTNSEGNHGEDVKEYYFYLDSTPAHSYMKHLYKYPQNAWR
jgi:hypothetical protein